MVVSVVAVEQEAVVSLLVEHLAVVLVMVEVVLLADLVELLVVGVDTKVVLEDSKEFLNIKLLTLHLVTYHHMRIRMVLVNVQ